MSTAIRKNSTLLKDRFLGEKKDNLYVVILLYFLVALLCFLLVIIAFFQLCLIDGDSMNNTLKHNDHVMLLKTSAVDHGDIVVISKKDANGVAYNVIKRVLGVEGDQLEFKTENGKINLYRKDRSKDEFVKLNEPYILEDMQDGSFWKNFKPDSGAFTVPQGAVFVLGDNRNHSEDSRGKDKFYTEKSIYGKMSLLVEKDSLLEIILKFIYNEKTSTTGQ